MATTEFTERIISGLNELTGELSSPSSGDIFSLVVDSDCIVEDIITNVTGSIQYSIQLVYPSSGMILPIATYLSSNFIMNAYGNSQRLIYSLPKWTKLQIVVDSASGATLKLCAIGKA